MKTRDTKHTTSRKQDVPDQTEVNPQEPKLPNAALPSDQRVLQQNPPKSRRLNVGGPRINGAYCSSPSRGFGDVSPFDAVVGSHPTYAGSTAIIFKWLHAVHLAVPKKGQNYHWALACRARRCGHAVALYWRFEVDAVHLNRVRSQTRRGERARRNESAGQ